MKEMVSVKNVFKGLFLVQQTEVVFRVSLLIRIVSIPRSKLSFIVLFVSSVIILIRIIIALRIIMMVVSQINVIIVYLTTIKIHLYISYK